MSPSPASQQAVGEDDAQDAAGPPHGDTSLQRNGLFIAGAWQAAADGKVDPVLDPFTGRVRAHVARGGGADAERAVVAAAGALDAWGQRTAEDRGRHLRRWFDLIVKNQEALARILTGEQGKPLTEARAEIAYAASYIEWFAEEARRLYGETIPSPWPDRRLVVVREPVGVCAAITPWNFPAAMVTRKVAPALAAGCTMIVKPAPQTPLTALALAELAHRAGFPPGVLNVVPGDAVAIGSVLTASPVVRKLSFTGSTAVGRVLAAQCAPTLKKLSLELGGNAPFIVFDDADLDAAVEGAMASKFRNSGQTCVCANRFLVQAGVYDEFARRLAVAVNRLQVGSGLDEAVNQGPLIDGAALSKVCRLVDGAVAGGARALCGGAPHALGGNFFAPTVLVDVAPVMQISQQEIFGPVAALMRFEGERDAVALANAGEAGLAAYVYTRDAARNWRMAAALQFGMVGLNTGVISTAVAPFGGVKQSGMGREGSRHGILDYTELKTLCMAT